LESKIDADTSYQKQQETLIVWSENDSDMALSFQEKMGCEEVWAKICNVQGKDPSVEVTQDSIDEEDEEETGSSSMASYGPELNGVNAGGVPLPPCEMAKLDKIYEVVQAFMSHPHQRDKLATAIEQEDYIKKLLDVFRQCEDLENTGLFAFSSEWVPEGRQDSWHFLRFFLLFCVPSWPEKNRKISAR
jgi:protein phosphatase 4 regulatory subunit 3